MYHGQFSQNSLIVSYHPLISASNTGSVIPQRADKLCIVSVHGYHQSRTVFVPQITILHHHSSCHDLHEIQLSRRRHEPNKHSTLLTSLLRNCKHCLIGVRCVWTRRSVSGARGVSIWDEALVSLVLDVNGGPNLSENVTTPHTPDLRPSDGVERGFWCWRLAGLPSWTVDFNADCQRVVSFMVIVVP